MLRPARQCGISTAESRIETVGGKDVLLIKRFDREKTKDGYTRARMISGLTVLRADEGVQTRPRWSYMLLVEELRRISAEPRKDARELFRLAESRKRTRNNPRRLGLPRIRSMTS